VLTRQFWFSDTGVLVRALRTFAQTAISAIGVGQTNLFTADLKNVLALSVSAAVLSILMSMDRSAAAAAAVSGTPAEIVPQAVVVAAPEPTAPVLGCGDALR
jgi:hypothetical protein